MRLYRQGLSHPHIFQAAHPRQRWSRDSSGAQAAGVRLRRTFQGCLVNGRLINVLPLPLQTKGLECRRMPADLLQMEEIESLNRILITGQRRVYTVDPFQLGHNTNKTEKGAGIASLCRPLGIQCLAQTDNTKNLKSSSLQTFCFSVCWCCIKLLLEVKQVVQALNRSVNDGNHSYNLALKWSLALWLS